MSFGRYVPVSKSVAIRAIMLDLATDRRDVPSVTDVIGNIADLPDDVIAAVKLSEDLKAGRNVVSVGESGTLYRFLIYWARKNKRLIEFTTSGTLRNREITIPDNLLDLSYDELLALDNGTSQWASAAMICGKQYELTLIGKSPFLAITLNTMLAYKRAMPYERGPYSILTPDMTFVRQFDHYERVMNNPGLKFVPVSSEDFCYAVAMGADVEELLERFPSVIHHESNRYEAMKLLAVAGPVPNSIHNSKDHRVIMAAAMKYGVGPNLFTYPQCVSKSCPRFWEFMKYMKDNYFL